MNPGRTCQIRIYERNHEFMPDQNEVCHVIILSIHCVYEVFSHSCSLILDRSGLKYYLGQI